jgi:threonine/homoserine/homoserine lactone efflux protein
VISAIVSGFIFGLSSGLAPGPLLVLVITQALRHSVKEGIKVAVAPLITDLPIILVSLFVLTRLNAFHRALGFISFVGGIYVLYLSYDCFRTRPVTLEDVKIQPRSVRKGVVVNLLNPHPYLFWLTFGGPFILKVHQESSLAPIFFLASFYLLLIGSKVFLALIAGRSKDLLKSRGYLFVMRGLAVVLALFAFFLIRDGVSFLKTLT